MTITAVAADRLLTRDREFATLGVPDLVVVTPLALLEPGERDGQGTVGDQAAR